MKRKAFTLIELLVLIAMLAILAGAVISVVEKDRTHTRLAALPPVPTAYVMDTAGVLSGTASHTINEQCARWDTTNGGQLLVYVGTTLPENEDVESYSQKLFRQWKPGEKGKNRGALFVVFTKSRKMRIHTGYGLEAQLTDAVCKRILDESVKPLFKANQWEDGIRAGVSGIIQAATLAMSEVQTPVVITQSLAPSWIAANVIYIIMCLAVLATFWAWATLRGRRIREEREKQQRSQEMLEARQREIARLQERDRQIAAELARVREERAREEQELEERNREIERFCATEITRVVEPKSVPSKPHKPQTSPKSNTGKSAKKVAVAGAAAAAIATAIVVARNKEAEQQAVEARKRQEERKRHEEEERQRKREEEEAEEKSRLRSSFSVSPSWDSSSSSSSSSDSSPSCGGGDSGGGGASSDC